MTTLVDAARRARKSAVSVVCVAFSRHGKTLATVSVFD